MVIGTWVEIYIGERFYFDRWVIRIAAVALYLINYYILATRGHGIKFEREFSNLKKSRKVLLLASCVVMVLVAIAVSIYSVSAYHNYFHIVTKKGF